MISDGHNILFDGFYLYRSSILGLYRRDGPSWINTQNASGNELYVLEGGVGVFIAYDGMIEFRYKEKIVYWNRRISDE